VLSPNHMNAVNIDLPSNNTGISCMWWHHNHLEHLDLLQNLHHKRRHHIWLPSHSTCCGDSLLLRKNPKKSSPRNDYMDSRRRCPPQHSTGLAGKLMHHTQNHDDTDSAQSHLCTMLTFVADHKLPLVDSTGHCCIAASHNVVPVACALFLPDRRT